MNQRRGIRVELLIVVPGLRGSDPLPENHVPVEAFVALVVGNGSAVVVEQVLHGPDIARQDARPFSLLDGSHGGAGYVDPARAVPVVVVGADRIAGEQPALHHQIGEADNRAVLADVGGDASNIGVGSAMDLVVIKQMPGGRTAR